MKKSTMFFYNELRKTNPLLSKTRAGRSFLMKQAVYTSEFFVRFNGSLNT